MKHILIVADEDISIYHMLLRGLDKHFHVYRHTEMDDLYSDKLRGASLAIIDQSFDGNQGPEWVELIAAAHPSLPVIYTTSRCEKGTCLRLLRFAVRDCLRKPYTVVELEETITKIYAPSSGQITAWRSHVLDQAAVGSADRNSRRIARVRGFINDHLDKPLSLGLLSKLACMSEFHFCRIFKKHVGVSSIIYINRARIEKAIELLEHTELNINQICQRVGFNDLTYFERVFKKCAGCSPSTFRRTGVSDAKRMSKLGRKLGKIV